MVDPVAAALRLGFRRLARRGLRGVWLRGTVPAAPFVWAANHHSWWDPFVAATVLGDRPACLLVAEENLRRYGFVARVGAFGARNPRRGLDLLRSGRVLLVYPEGELRPPGAPGPLARGAAWFALRAPAPLVAAAVRVVLRGHQVPEAYVSLSAVDLPSGADGADAVAGTSASLASRLAAELTDVDALIAGTAPREPLPGFALVARGHRSWDERL